MKESFITISSISDYQGREGASGRGRPVGSAPQSFDLLRDEEQRGTASVFSLYFIVNLLAILLGRGRFGGKVGVVPERTSLAC